MNRIEQLQRKLKSDEGYLLTSPVNRRYYTGMDSSAGVLLLSKNHAALLLDFRYFEAGQQRVSDCEVVLQTELVRQVLDWAHRQELSKLFIETERMTVADYRGWKDRFADAGITLPAEGILDEAINRQRMQKDAAELAAIRAAQAITDAAFAAALPLLHEGMTEREVAHLLERLMQEQGGEGLAFATIAVSGEKSALPHGEPGDRVIRSGDFLTMDFGAKKDGYCSDMTRTIAFGAISDEQRRVYETVLAAQNAAFAVIRAGVEGSRVDAAARNVIEAAGYHGAFGHSLGHSLGLEIHESPNFSPKETKLIPAGAVLSVEPGIYLAGRYGVRIEDIVVLTENGCENLTDSPKQLILR